MTSAEKNQIYNLLKTASDSLYGFTSPDFPAKAPEFADDVEIKTEKAEVQSENQNQENAQVSSNQNQKSSTLENIASKIRECKRCDLCQNRIQAVPGMGVSSPLVLVIGEGPGEEEDKQGLPFVGPAGQLLDKMLAAIHLYRNKNCYIANIVKCRPPANRTPFPAEADACRPFLDAQIAALKPKAILCAGSTAVKNLFHTSDGVMRLHGKVLSFNGIPVVTTWHPSALLRAPENKRPAWKDLKIFRSELLKIEPDYEK